MSIAMTSAPFGTQMPGMCWNEGDGYRYGFNGMERDNEIYGTSNSYDFGARMMDTRLGRWWSLDPLSNEYPSYSDYIFVANSPNIFIDPVGKEIFPVHGTWADYETFEDLPGLIKASDRLFKDSKLSNLEFRWSGANAHIARVEAAKMLVNEILEKVKYGTKVVTIPGHSHGGNVGIISVNMMVEMKEFDGVEINLLTINTPVRDDYQLSKKALERVNHVNVYDPEDPVQVSGGNTISNVEFFEIGPAGRIFNNATNIEVDDSQGIFPLFGPNPSDFHNSHNHINDWFPKLSIFNKSLNDLKKYRNTKENNKNKENKETKENKEN